MFQWMSKTKTQKRTKGGRDNLSDIERVQDNNHKKKKCSTNWEEEWMNTKRSLTKS